MEYEKVVDKVKKLQALVEQGVEGEVKAAKRALDTLCINYNIKIESLFAEEIKWHVFKLPYYDKYACDILFQCYGKVMNTTVTTYKQNKYGNLISFELTNIQYMEIKEMFDFYFKQWKKEKKELLESLKSAFINKHNLFADCTPSSNEEMTSERWMKLLKMKSLMDQLEDVEFYKRIE